MYYSKELQTAVEAMRAIRDTEEMHVLASEYNRHVNFLRKSKGSNVVLGDKIVWKYGGLEKTGTVVKVNKVSVEVQNVGNTPFGATTKVDKSLITGKVAA
jgi:hypothetical protein